MTRQEELEYCLRRAQIEHDRALRMQNMPAIAETFRALGYVREAIRNEKLQATPLIGDDGRIWACRV